MMRDVTPLSETAKISKRLHENARIAFQNEPVLKNNVQNATIVRIARIDIHIFKRNSEQRI